MSSASFIKLQAGHSEGLVASTLRSDDGGFQFGSYSDASFVDAMPRPTAPTSASGSAISSPATTAASPSTGRPSTPATRRRAKATIKDTERYGGTFRMPVTSRVSVAAKGDSVVEDQGLETRAIEVTWPSR
jgi:hypothetical protein